MPAAASGEPEAQPDLDPAALISSEAPRFGLIKRSIKPLNRRVGATQLGEWYLYGATATSTDKEPIEALGTPGIIDVRLVVRSTASSYGSRSYLDVSLRGETPEIQYTLSLPCLFRDPATDVVKIQRAPRSLLSCLVTLDLAGTPLKLEPSRGKKANFVNVYLDPDGQVAVTGSDIGATEADLHKAIDTCRRSLSLPAQFKTLASAHHEEAA